ncbi:hypothetical protein Shyhy01_14140 [Streptomyces hygroscopicus subsp. hygroscopicus]|nr:hypothetical protein Shyhy01_14140 [Streptomyces hygroscopicus subsp. hygroscopicus]
MRWPVRSGRGPAQGDARDRARRREDIGRQPPRPSAGPAVGGADGGVVRVRGDSRLPRSKRRNVT